MIVKFFRKNVLKVLPINEVRKRRIECELRAAEDRKRILKSDAIVVSYEKSGRTWLRVMLSRYFQQLHGGNSAELVELDTRWHPDVPVVFFTHDRNQAFNDDGWRELGERAPMIFLVRDPRDVAVSFYFHWKYRMSDHSKWLRCLPSQELSIFEFMMKEDYGLPAVIKFMNLWYQRLSYIPRLSLFRYEDMRADAVSELGRMLQLFGVDPKQEFIESVVEYAKFENMKRRERYGEVANSRLVSKDPGNPDSYKSRRAKIGGYRDYFSGEEVSRIDDMVESTLSPAFGYSGLNGPE